MRVKSVKWWFRGYFHHFHVCVRTGLCEVWKCLLPCEEWRAYVGAKKAKKLKNLWNYTYVNLIEFFPLASTGENVLHLHRDKICSKFPLPSVELCPTSHCDQIHNPLKSLWIFHRPPFRRLEQVRSKEWCSLFFMQFLKDCDFLQSHLKNEIKKLKIVT